MISNHYSLSTLIYLAVPLALLVGTQGAAKRVIVDDADTRILYSSNGWATETTCPACLPQLDKSQVHDRTWHFSNNTANTGFTFFFTGTSVELRYIASDTVQLLAQRVSYAIDGTQLGIAAQHQQLNPISFAYDQSLFSVTGLTNGKHTLQVNIVQSSSVFFDYLIYEDEDIVIPPTTNIAPITSPNSNPTSMATTSNIAPSNASPNSGPTSPSSTTTITPNAGPSNIAVLSINNSTSNISKGSGPTTTMGTINIILNTSTDSSPTTGSTSSPDVSPPNSGSNSNINIGATIGGVVSGVAIIAVGIVLWRFLKRRRGAQLRETSDPNVDSESLGVTPAAPRFIGHPKYNILNTGANYVPPASPELPVEAGLMSRSRFPSFPSDVSRRTPAST